MSERLYIYKDYKFLTDYFIQSINNNTLAHCILFWGNDIQAQYDLALEVARLLNCKQDKAQDCNCLNCSWIRQNTHPAVLTYTKFDNKPPKDTSKTVISVAQAHAIKQSLSITSEYHRVFIFCDKDKNEEGKLLGLNQNVFQDEATNALLKTFEEPPSKTTFFFLAKDVSDIISTVVSRSQCFFVPSQQDEPQNYELVKDVMENYLECEREKVLDFNDKIYELTKENLPNVIFTQMQNYLVNLLKSNLENKLLKIRLIKAINYLEQAKREYNLGINIQTITENLAYSMILGTM